MLLRISTNRSLLFPVQCEVPVAVAQILGGLLYVRGPSGSWARLTLMTQRPSCASVCQTQHRRYRTYLLHAFLKLKDSGDSDIELE